VTLILGWLVGIVDVAQFIPQARRTAAIRHDRAAMAGLSVTTWVIASIQGAAWVVYGFATDHLPVAIPNVIITPICLTILGMRLSHRPAADDEAPLDARV
jgi:uncharacterized protein with PQ loop repeat